jgi:HEAT repeat protein
LAIETLGRVATSDARTLLRGLARSPDWIVRAHVARALGAADPGDADVARLRELALDTHPLVAASAREALSSQ